MMLPDATIFCSKKLFEREPEKTFKANGGVKGHKDWTKIKEDGKVDRLCRVFLRFLEIRGDHHLWDGKAFTSEAIDQPFFKWGEEAGLINNYRKVSYTNLYGYDGSRAGHVLLQLWYIGVLDRTWKNKRYYWDLSEEVKTYGINWIVYSAYLGATTGLNGHESGRVTEKYKVFRGKHRSGGSLIDGGCK